MRARDERGVGTMLTLGVAFALISVTTLSVFVIGWFTVIRQAEHVAELAALAGASAAAQGKAPCDGAAEAARQNGLEVSRCVVRGSGADVVVEVGVSVELKPSIGPVPQKIQRLATAGTM